MTKLYKEKERLTIPNTENNQAKKCSHTKLTAI